MYNYIDLIMWLLFAAMGAVLTMLHYGSKEKARADAWADGYKQAQREEYILITVRSEAKNHMDQPAQHKETVELPRVAPFGVTPDFVGRMRDNGQATMKVVRNDA